ncbi:TrmB family transcriptional regulator [Halobaculum litoreum]|uniref:TrmB family transcriptional regulator n=1 Tax=Halobaculum litoreum TaxID=3031998 RepID=A0ABD5XSQ0_9EURY
MTDSSTFAERRQVGDPQRRVADGGTDPAAVVTEELTELGLTTYAARTFVALTCHGPSTAKEISSVADVPRTRVYDSVEELEQEGLAAVAGSDPLRFVATPLPQAVRVLRTRVRDRLTRLEAGLDDVAEGDTGGSRESASWTAQT